MRPILSRRVPPELLFGLFNVLLWLLLALEVSKGVLTPLAQVLGSLSPDLLQ
jgi:hypothetical protein